MADLLLVDDDPRLAGLLARFLERRGHRVRTATSFVRARELLDERVPEVLLSDVDLGAESGPVELRRLATEGRLPPTLVLSGYLDAALVRELEHLPGVRGTLAKPCDPAQIERRVRELLAGTIEPRGAGGEAEVQGEEGWVEILPWEDERA